MSHFQRTEVHGKAACNGLRRTYYNNFDDEHRARWRCVGVDKHALGKSPRPSLRVIGHRNQCCIARCQRPCVVARRGASARSPCPGDDQVLVAGIDITEDALGRLRAFGKSAEVIFGAAYPRDFGVGKCREGADECGRDCKECAERVHDGLRQVFICLRKAQT